MRKLGRPHRATPACRLKFLVAPLLVSLAGCLAHEKELRALAYMGAVFSPPGRTSEIHWTTGFPNDDSGLGLGLGLTDAKLQEAFPYLRPLHRLYLDLSGTSVTDESMPLVATLKNLEELNVYGLKVTATGLEALREAPALHTIYLADGQITDAEAERLRHTLPKVTIYAKNGRITTG